jgi:hypothetical protein
LATRASREAISVVSFLLGLSGASALSAAQAYYLGGGLLRAQVSGDFLLSAAYHQAAWVGASQSPAFALGAG